MSPPSADSRGEAERSALAEFSPLIPAQAGIQNHRRPWVPASAGTSGWGNCEPWRADIERSVRRWWPLYPFPPAWAAQLWQESRCDPLAVSPAGARGLAQFMPATWAETAARLRLPPGSTPHGRLAIDTGAFYMARQMAAWTAKRPMLERWRLALASYNAGLGNVLAAQRACQGARDWRELSPCMAAVTGRHAAETLGYVRLIPGHWRRFGGCAPFAAPATLQQEWRC